MAEARAALNFGRTLRIGLNPSEYKAALLRIRAGQESVFPFDYLNATASVGSLIESIRNGDCWPG